jgi:hypothetical protein
MRWPLVGSCPCLGWHEVQRHRRPETMGGLRVGFPQDLGEGVCCEYNVVVHTGAIRATGSRGVPTQVWIKNSMGGPGLTRSTKCSLGSCANNVVGTPMYYIYIYTHTSPRVMDPLVNRSPTEPGGTLRVRTWSCPAWPILVRARAGRSRLARIDPVPHVQAASWSSRCGPDRADGPHTTTTSRDPVIFHGSLNHFDKASIIFTNSVILRHILKIFCLVILVE